MTKQLRELGYDEKYDSFNNLGLEFYAFASDVLKQLSEISDERLLEAGVAVLKTDFKDPNTKELIVKVSFSCDGTTYTLEKRKPNYTVPWLDETIIGCCCPEDGNSFKFGISKRLAFSQSTASHFNNSFSIKDEKNNLEAVVVRVSPLHCVKGSVDDFSFVLKDSESKEKNKTLVESSTPCDYGFTSYGSFPFACIVGGKELEKIRAGWEIVYKRLGLAFSPNVKALSKN